MICQVFLTFAYVEISIPAFGLEFYSYSTIFGECWLIVSFLSTKWETRLSTVDLFLAVNASFQTIMIIKIQYQDRLVKKWTSLFLMIVIYEWWDLLTACVQTPITVPPRWAITYTRTPYSFSCIFRCMDSSEAFYSYHDSVIPNSSHKKN